VEHHERYRVPYLMLVGDDSAFAARVSGLTTTVRVARDGRVRRRGAA
jgi:hypothetical protein